MRGTEACLQLEGRDALAVSSPQGTLNALHLLEIDSRVVAPVNTHINTIITCEKKVLSLP